MADCSLSTYLPVASSLLGAITGGGIGFLTARFAINRNARAAAAAKLRAAFTPELIAMRFDRGKEKFDADRILRDAFLRHATAVEEFRTFVKPRNKLAYEQAWRQYYEVGGSVRFFDYMMGDDPLGCFETRVRAILRFAE